MVVLLKKAPFTTSFAGIRHSFVFNPYFARLLASECWGLDPVKQFGQIRLVLTHLILLDRKKFTSRICLLSRGSVFISSLLRSPLSLIFRLKHQDFRSSQTICQLTKTNSFAALFYISLVFKKHCQRHNGPEGWVHITSLQFTLHSSQILIKLQF